MNKTTQRRAEKWSQPGWRIEQKYANNVLVGNWLEEKLQFTREPETANSTSRMDYLPHWDFKPDISMRPSALRRAEGLPSKLLLGHHGTPPSHYLVTLYDETYGRERLSAPAARQRSWHPDSLTWQPERSDHPAPAPPTNFDLRESKQRRLDKQQQQPRLPSASVYRSAYQRHPPGAFCQNRFARAPRALSSHLHAANHNNKDLDLRQRSLLQVPDRSPGLLPPLPAGPRQRPI